VDDEKTASKVACAGSLFVGPWTAQVAGDYALGSNHVLPTSGAARVRGGLSAADFVRQITVQRVTEPGLRAIGPTVTALAETEGLTAHARSVALRLNAAGGGRNGGRSGR
jgi:histidinol dehydrogenase